MYFDELISKMAQQKNLKYGSWFLLSFIYLAIIFWIDIHSAVILTQMDLNPSQRCSVEVNALPFSATFKVSCTQPRSRALIIVIDICTQLKKLLMEEFSFLRQHLLGNCRRLIYSYDLD